MRGMLFGLTIALASLATSAGPAGAPVTVQNTPLPVSLTTIPQDMQQRRPIDVQIVGPAVDLDQVRGVFVNILCSGTIEESNGLLECTPPSATIQGAPVYVRMVTFTPAAFVAPPNVDPAGLHCQAALFLSKNGGMTYTRIVETGWTPPNFAPVHITLPVPIVFQPGTPFAAKVRLWMENGPSDAGCQVRVIAFATQP